MESNVKRIEEALAELREAADKALVAVRGGSVYEAPLEVVRRLTPDSMEMAMSVHVELTDQLAEYTSSCGYADVEMVAVVNGLKDLVERVDGGWYYEEGGWHARSELLERAPRARMEVAK